MKLDGYKTYILCTLAIAWIVLTGLLDLGVNMETRITVCVAILSAAGITMRMGAKSGGKQP
jgi:hypothetical protein